MIAGSGASVSSSRSDEVDAVVKFEEGRGDTSNVDVEGSFISDDLDEDARIRVTAGVSLDGAIWPGQHAICEDNDDTGEIRSQGLDCRRNWQLEERKATVSKCADAGVSRSDGLPPRSDEESRTDTNQL